MYFDDDRFAEYEEEFWGDDDQAILMYLIDSFDEDDYFGYSNTDE